MSKTSVIFITALLLFSATLSAQIATDGSLGPPAQNLQGPNYEIGADLGEQRGSNLFHSFQEFNLKFDESASFSGPNSIQNVISRVTGQNPSNIDGLIYSEMLADFYFLNPYGIIFGPNAALDVQGSFHASTADYLRLGENKFFYSSLGKESILSVASPAAFGFLDYEPGTITIQGSSIEVLEEQQISLISGDVFIEGGALYAPSGRINLAAATSKGEVILTTDNLLMDTFDAQGNIELFPWVVNDQLWGLSDLDVSGNGGQIFIRSGQLVLDNALILADTYGEQSGLIDIAISGHIQLTNGSGISGINYGEGPGTQVTITANELQLDGIINIADLEEILYEIHDSSIEDLVSEYGMTVQDAQLLQQSAEEMLNEPAENLSWERLLDSLGRENIADQYRSIFIGILNSISIGNVSNSSESDGGQIQINTSILTLNSSLIEAFTEGSGKAGNIQVDAEQVNLSTISFINAAVGFNPEPELELIASGSGQGGDITINASESLSVLDFSSITVSTDDGTTGNAGTVSLTTPSLRLNNVAQINSFSAGDGNAGILNINANTALLTNGSGIYTEADNAGGGNITLNVRDNLHVEDSLISAKASGDEPQDKGGNITIHNPQLDNNGNITIRKLTLVRLAQKSQLLTTGFVGDGGNINIFTNNLEVSNDSQIDSSSQFGLNGAIRINSLELNENFMVKPLDYLDGSAWFNNRCAGLTRDTISKFLITIRDGLPPGPGDLMTDYSF
jgi:filamentous hemagglutinin family protein